MRLVLQAFKKLCRPDPATAAAGHCQTQGKRHCYWSGGFTGTACPQEATRKEQGPSLCSSEVPSKASSRSPWASIPERSRGTGGAESQQLNPGPVGTGGTCALCRAGAACSHSDLMAPQDSNDEFTASLDSAYLGTCPGHSPVPLRSLGEPPSVPSSVNKPGSPLSRVGGQRAEGRGAPLP